MTKYALFEKQRLWSHALPLAVCLWWLVGLLLGFFWTDLQVPFIFLERILLSIWIGAGMVILSQHLWAQFRFGDKTAAWLFAFSMLAVGIGLNFMWPFLTEFGDHYRFRRRFEANQNRYESIVSRLVTRAKFDEGWQKEGSIDYFVEAGPPLRIAFRQPGGILDNWQGVIYDPSGAVLRSAQFKTDFSNWNAPTLRDIKHLFGGELMYCKHLKGHFYRCWFT